MKKTILFLLATTTIFAKDNTFDSSLSPNIGDRIIAQTELPNQYPYLSFGFTCVFPTANLGYRVMYKNMASDFSLSWMLIPNLPFGISQRNAAGSFHYKQLFFPADQSRERSVYYGAQTGLYSFFHRDSKSPWAEVGAVLGFQRKTKSGITFFEVTANVVPYHRGLGLLWYPSFAYAFSF